MRCRVGIDIGGTFSDLVLLDDDGKVETVKVSSDPERLLDRLVEGLGALLARSGLRPDAAEAIVHGSTVATNAILEYRGARAGLITTRGFRDVLEIRRLRVGRLYDLAWEKPPPLISRRLRFEVTERLDSRGGVVTPLDLGEAARVVDRLLVEDVEAIAISLLHSYANGEHERQVADLVRRRAPNLHLSLSHELLPEVGEYERTSTAAINAYVGPVVDRYLGSLEGALRQAGLSAPLLMMQSSGGVMGATIARRQPVHVIESGPAAGVVAALALAQRTGEPNLITMDMGGTTAKASIIENGVAFQTTEYEVGGGISAGSRMFRGGGHALRVPALDIAEVGAGGGSLVRVDAGGGIKVGPESAGASPGPVCYGLGNQQPTLTDANLVLGYLNPTHLLGGSMAIDFDSAARALRQQVADPLGLSLERTAHGIHRIAVSNMVRVARAVSTDRGRDPRLCTLLAFGGNGPVHAAEVARQLGISRVLVPPWPGLFSAFGLLAADARHELVQALRRPLLGTELDELHRQWAVLERLARATLRDEGFSEDAASFEPLVDLRYQGQSQALRLSLGRRSEDDPIRALAERFENEHEQTYGHRDRPERIELVNVRLVARAKTVSPEPRLSSSPSRGASRRPAFFGAEHGTVDTPVVGRGQLDRTARSGPLIIEEYDSTTVVPPDATARLDEWENIVIEV